MSERARLMGAANAVKWSLVKERVEQLVGDSFQISENVTQDSAQGSFLRQLVESSIREESYTDDSQQSFDLFWVIDKELIAMALIGVKVNESIAKSLPEGSQRQDVYRERSKQFARIAEILLDRYEREDAGGLRSYLVSPLEICTSHSVFELAITVEVDAFLGKDICQEMLQDVWRGNLKRTPHYLLKVFFTVLLPPHVYFMEYEDPIAEDSWIKRGALETHDKFLDWMNRWKFTRYLRYMYSAPAAKYFVNFITYIAYLFLFSWVILEATPEEPTWWEYLLALGTLSITTDEMWQIFSPKGRLLVKIMNHYSSVWNMIDFASLSLFWVGFGIRHLPYVDNPHAIGWARWCYITCLGFSYLKLLNFFAIHKTLGPLVTVMTNMIVPLIQFMSIWAVFCVGFGVMGTAALKPVWQTNIEWLIKTPVMPYWNTYGELGLDSIQEEIENRSKADGLCVDFNVDNPDNLPPCARGAWGTYAVLAAFMIAGNILLLNLLIAVFSSIYDATIEQSMLDWKMKRMYLILDNADRSPVPPPAAIIHNLYLIGYAIVYSWPSPLYKPGLNDNKNQEFWTRIRSKDASFAHQCRAELAEKAMSVEDKLNEMKEMIASLQSGVQSK